MKTRLILRYITLFILTFYVSISQSVSFAAPFQLKNFMRGKPPSKLSETGLFDSLNPLSPAGFLRPYSVISPLWSDGAAKRRWLVLPPQDLGDEDEEPVDDEDFGIFKMQSVFPFRNLFASESDPIAPVEFRPDEPWAFPVGALFIKHFILRKNVSEFYNVETRILVHSEEDDWLAFTYEWQDDQSEAELLKRGKQKNYIVYDPVMLDQKRLQTWTYPGRQDCAKCHNAWSGYALGVRTEQLNREVETPSGPRNQLELWNDAHLFTSQIKNPKQYEHYADPTDQSLPIEKRARSYLAANCSNCHSPGFPRGNMDLRFKVPFSQTSLLHAYPIAGDLNLPQPELLTPGAKENSILWRRVNTLSSVRMPQIGSNVIDTTAVELVGAWIDSMSEPQSSSIGTAASPAPSSLTGSVSLGPKKLDRSSQF